ncbi:MAG: LysM peptidoglycan-binding domain-containing protein [Bacteroidota bacterium]
MSRRAVGYRRSVARTLSLAAILSGMLFPLSVAAQSLDDALADLRTAARVEQALGAHDELHAFDYVLRVEGGVLTLGGVLPNQTLRLEALALAGATSGVQQVVDSLVVPDAPVVADGTASDSVVVALPETKPEPALPVAPAETYHTVRRGDTLFRIAQQHGTTVAAIRRLNNLRSNTINVGQRLRVR